MTRSGWVLAILLGMVGLCIGGWQLLFAPVTLTVAVGLANGDDARVMAAFAQQLVKEEQSVRLRLLHTDGYAATAAAIAAGKVDLAVVRTDIDLPSNASSIAILRRDVVFLVARPDVGITRIADLVGKKIATNKAQPANKDLLESILAHYDIPPSAVTHLSISTSEARDLIRKREVDAIFAVAPLDAAGLATTIAAITESAGAGPIFVPIREAAAIAQRRPELEPSEILRGAFGGDPPKPADPVPSLSVTRRLMAANKLSDTRVAELTRSLFQLRTEIERQAPAAADIEPPETERGQSLPTHPGAIAYVDGEQTSFIERNVDLMYIGGMLLSLVASLGVAFWSRAAQGRRREAMSGLGELVKLLALARAAVNEDALDAVEREADSILEDAIEDATDYTLDGTGLAAYRLAFDQVGRAVAHRRIELAAGAAATGQGVNPSMAQDQSSVLAMALRGGQNNP
jgi:TRAP transporter TAXI family solute receptor